MTVLLDQAIRDLAANYGLVYQVKEEPIIESRRGDLERNS